MFFSYLGILVIPMALAMVLYIYTFRVITGQAETMNENLLVMVKNEIDNEMDNIWKITSRLALDSKIQQTANVKGAYDANDQINLYHICPRHLLMTCLFCLIIPRKWSVPEAI